MRPPRGKWKLIWPAAILVAALLAPAGASAYERYADLSYGSDQLQRLDLYTPDGSAKGDGRPLVVWVHGGGWTRGDKSNRIPAKASYFTEEGFVFASLNYRLSPDPPETADAGRIRFPDHPEDVGAALGWLDRNGERYGASPEEIVLIGHSAGAQLVSLVATDPTYVKDNGLEPWQIVATVSLDTDAFDIAEQATQTGNVQNRTVIWNAFATPAENAAEPVWNRASPLNAADPKDGSMLFVTSFNPRRVAPNQAMATALGYSADSVLSLPYSHEQFNTMLGTDDPAGETDAVMNFLLYSFIAATPDDVRLTKKPRKKVRTKAKRAKVKFKFEGKLGGVDQKFQCKLDKGNWRGCRSPEKLKVKRGKHTFRVRNVTTRGRTGEATSYRFKVVRR